MTDFVPPSDSDSHSTGSNWVQPGPGSFGSSSTNYADQKIGRNDLCPCGSGKKFKNCCIGKRTFRFTRIDAVFGLIAVIIVGLLVSAFFWGVFWPGLSLGRAAGAGDIQKVREILSESPQLVNSNPDGSSPLHYAAANGHLEIVRLLLEHGAVLARENENGITAEDWARQSGHEEVASYLGMLREQNSSKEQLDRMTGFLHKWKFDPTTSHYELGEKPQSGEYRLSKDGASVRAEMSWRDASGADHAMEFIGIPDGKKYPYENPQIADAMSMTLIDEITLETKAFKGDVAFMTATRRLIDDSTMEIITEGLLPDGGTYRNLAIYRKTDD